MLPQRRHAEILRCLTQEGSASVTALCAQLATSAATIRRDLIWLEREGVLTRVHGGAVLAPSQEERPFDRVAREDGGVKDEVAKAAATLVRDGESILLDIGTTTHRLAAHLRGRDITVLTSNLAVYEELADDHAVELILLGGVVRRNYRSMVGFLTEDALRQVRADRVFLGAAGVRDDGSVMDDTVVEVPLKRAMLAAADQVVLLADRGKFPGGGLARICGAEEIDVLVTNADTAGAGLSAVREAGVEVIEG
ncbi:DeoR/GlpR family DNA-binding transcription regulator [Kibdelosporangium phytohabitans]|uniref:ArsR family transcriptional regulator n=1 Tax=Kibdelosporangium phytohabitans TaxID=860235 RepID=A0A0N9IAN0_9PSEU|nr:DeoR/GlpR family DNA-binding transcription regulator [Kibdelosporangium phytohabitans]ALG13177.1 ArsR family transcriptional regulator [Kibdelosporangium phytohabitans]MBE1464937.1 DeoR/GlpR family transcriptional regulator of sugar metabolism [Kibdelosporangium phytohabitans]